MPKPHLLHALTKALRADPPASADGLGGGAVGGTASARTGGPPTLVVLGVGSELRSDDAAGLHVSGALSKAALPGVHAMDAGPAPENCTAEIRRLRPRCLVIVDCALMGEEPGTLRVFKPSEIAGVSFGTHGLPLNVLADFLMNETGCTAAVLGIEPVTTEFGEALSPRVEAAVREAVDLLRELSAGADYFA
jgi:hydrogenase 3 maturation protease